MALPPTNLTLPLFLLIFLLHPLPTPSLDCSNYQRPPDLDTAVLSDRNVVLYFLGCPDPPGGPQTQNFTYKDLTSFEENWEKRNFIDHALARRVPFCIPHKYAEVSYAQEFLPTLLKGIKKAEDDEATYLLDPQGQVPRLSPNLPVVGLNSIKLYKVSQPPEGANYHGGVLHQWLYVKLEFGAVRLDSIYIQGIDPFLGTPMGHFRTDGISCTTTTEPVIPGAHSLPCKYRPRQSYVHPSVYVAHPNAGFSYTFGFFFNWVHNHCHNTPAVQFLIVTGISGTTGDYRATLSEIYDLRAPYYLNEGVVTKDGVPTLPYFIEPSKKQLVCTPLPPPHPTLDKDQANLPFSRVYDKCVVDEVGVDKDETCPPGPFYCTTDSYYSTEGDWNNWIDARMNLIKVCNDRLKERLDLRGGGCPIAQPSPADAFKHTDPHTLPPSAGRRKRKKRYAHSNNTSIMIREPESHSAPKSQLTQNKKPSHFTPEEPKWKSQFTPKNKKTSQVTPKINTVSYPTPESHQDFTQTQEDSSQFTPEEEQAFIEEEQAFIEEDQQMALVTPRRLIRHRRQGNQTTTTSTTTAPPPPQGPAPPPRTTPRYYNDTYFGNPCQTEAESKACQWKKMDLEHEKIGVLHYKFNKRIHAFLMITSFLVLVPIGNMMARYFKETSSKCCCGIPCWMMIHLFISYLALIVMWGGIIAILGNAGQGFANCDGNTTLSVDSNLRVICEEHQKYLAHALSGIVPVAFFHISVLSGWIRPRKGRGMWLTTHSFSGYLAPAAAYACMFANNQSTCIEPILEATLLLGFYVVFFMVECCLQCIEDRAIGEKDRHYFPMLEGIQVRDRIPPCLCLKCLFYLQSIGITLVLGALVGVSLEILNYGDEEVYDLHFNTTTVPDNYTVPLVGIFTHTCEVVNPNELLRLSDSKTEETYNSL